MGGSFTFFNRFLPRQVDNTYGGSKIALVIFGALVSLKLIIGWNCIFIGRSVAASADGIPLDTFPPAAAQAIVSDFAIWGVSQVMIGLLCILVLVRYRALVPLMFALLFLEFVCRRLSLHFVPSVTAGSPPGSIVNLVLISLIVLGLGLSLWSPGKQPRTVS